MKKNKYKRATYCERIIVFFFINSYHIVII